MSGPARPDVTVSGVGTDGERPPTEPDHHVTSYLCIGCPLGCRLEVEEDSATHDVVEVRGFSCRKGERFAIQEHTDPRRTVTTTVSVSGGRFPRLPVRTAEPAPKGLVRDLCRTLRSITVEAPVSMGDVIVADALGSGVKVVATRDMPERAAI